MGTYESFASELFGNLWHENLTFHAKSPQLQDKRVLNHNSSSNFSSSNIKTTAISKTIIVKKQKKNKTKKKHQDKTYRKKAVHDDIDASI